MICSINKQQMVQRYLARRLLVMYMENDRKLPAIKQLADDYGVGVGTLQGALQALKDDGAIELNACGASGTHIVRADQRKLFSACDYGELICLMPLNANPILRGLATGIYETVSQNGLPIHILFARGSRNRVKMVSLDKCNCAVMSRMAYEMARESGRYSIEMVCEVGLYSGEIGCVTRVDEPFEQGVTPVAYDNHSYDQAALHSILGLPEENRNDYLDVQLMDMVRMGEVKAALAERAAFQQEEGLVFHPLDGVSSEIQKKLVQAVLVVKEGEASLKRLLQSTVPLGTVSRIQAEVLEGKRFVKY